MKSHHGIGTPKLPQLRLDMKRDEALGFCESPISIASESHIWLWFRTKIKLPLE